MAAPGVVVQALGRTTPCGQVEVPAGHTWQVVDPMVGAKVPTGHSVQLVAMEGEYEPAAQGVHPVAV